jgi:hypothetical protein
MKTAAKAPSKKTYKAPTLQTYGSLTEMTKKHTSTTSDHGNNRKTA